jgi:hypothetical protein
VPRNKRRDGDVIKLRPEQFRAVAASCCVPAIVVLRSELRGTVRITVTRIMGTMASDGEPVLLGAYRRRQRGVREPAA